MNYSLDAGAMIAFMDGELGANVVEDVLTEPGCVCCAHIFNLTEIYYIYYRRGGQVLAESTIQDLFHLGIVFRNDARSSTYKKLKTYRYSSAICPICEQPLALSGKRSDHISLVQVAASLSHLAC